MAAVSTRTEKPRGWAGRLALIEVAGGIASDLLPETWDLTTLKRCLRLVTSTRRNLEKNVGPEACSMECGLPVVG